MGDELRSSGSKGEVQMDLRKSPRRGAFSRSFFAGGPIGSEGTAMNLSTKGCRIVSGTEVGAEDQFFKSISVSFDEAQKVMFWED